MAKCCWLMSARVALCLCSWLLERPAFCNSLSECKKCPAAPDLLNVVLLTPFKRGQPATTLLTASWWSAVSALIQLCHHSKSADVPDWWGKQTLFTSCKHHYNRKPEWEDGWTLTERVWVRSSKCNKDIFTYILCHCVSQLGLGFFFLVMTYSIKLNSNFHKHACSHKHDNDRPHTPYSGCMSRVFLFPHAAIISNHFFAISFSRWWNILESNNRPVCDSPNTVSAVSSVKSRRLSHENELLPDFIHSFQISHLWKSGGRRSGELVAQYATEAKQAWLLLELLCSDQQSSLRLSSLLKVIFVTAVSVLYNGLFMEDSFLAGCCSMACLSRHLRCLNCGLPTLSSQW